MKLRPLLPMRQRGDCPTCHWVSPHWCCAAWCGACLSPEGRLLAVSPASHRLSCWLWPDSALSERVGSREESECALLSCSESPRSATRSSTHPPSAQVLPVPDNWQLFLPYYKKSTMTSNKVNEECLLKTNKKDTKETHTYKRQEFRSSHVG